MNYLLETGSTNLETGEENSLTPDVEMTREDENPIPIKSEWLFTKSNKIGFADPIGCSNNLLISYLTNIAPLKSNEECLLSFLSNLESNPDVITWRTINDNVFVLCKSSLIEYNINAYDQNLNVQNI